MSAAAVPDGLSTIKKLYTSFEWDIRKPQNPGFKFICIALIVLALISIQGHAQLYIGITPDIGNRVKADPVPPGNLLKSTAMPSASLVVLIERRFGQEWLFQYGGSVGVLGYRLQARSYDTTATYHAPYQDFSSYTTFHFNVNAAIGRRFSLAKRSFSVAIGGGATMYSLYTEEGGLGRSHDNINFAYTLGRQDSAPRAFVDVSLLMPVGQWMTIGLSYRHHFVEALSGEYAFYQANASGKLSVTQRALTVMVLVRLTRSHH